MRCLLKVSIPVETADAAINDGSLGKTIESISPIWNPKPPILPQTREREPGSSSST
jgi:hypothetical protein